MKKTIKDLDLKGKAIIMRVDYNVSMVKQDDQMEIADDTRIRLSLPTIRYLQQQQPKRIVLMSHLGQPEQEHPDFSLKPVADYLTKALKKHVELIRHYEHKEVRNEIRERVNGEVILLENVRFHAGEDINDKRFAKALAELGDVFVNDAFGSSHRAHASVVGVAEYLPAVSGLLLAKEVQMIDNVMETPKHPLVAVIGGAKAATKIPMIEKLMTRADYLLLGGGVANTFLKAFGFRIGHSLYSPESVRIAQTLIWKATRVDTKLFLPQDLVVGSIGTGKKQGVVSNDAIPAHLMALDIGPKTIKDFAQILAQAKTIVWNGPMGLNELEPFAVGTDAVYQAIIENGEAISVVGGGDTLVSIKGHNHLDNITHVSTGGGAMLEYIEKGTLPGVEVLLDK